MKKYAITELFHTIQGEGAHAGSTAVFLRFASCNLWDNNPEHRERDAQRHGAECPRWCDTDFGVREKLTLQELLARIGAMPSARMIVVTGGEPLLQLDYELVVCLHSLFGLVAVETNGTVALPGALATSARHLLWVTMSPKTAPEEIKLDKPDEIKVVFPDYDPFRYMSFAGENTRLYVQPRAACEVAHIGKSVLHLDTMQRAAEFVMRNPDWRLSIQTHKLVGVP